MSRILAENACISRISFDINTFPGWSVQSRVSVVKDF